MIKKQNKKKRENQWTSPVWPGLIIYQLRIDDAEMHFWDSDPTEQILTGVPIQHVQLLIKSIRGCCEKELACGIG